jgi:hypothetical protein
MKCDFNLLKFINSSFVAKYVLYTGEYSVCAWEEYVSAAGEWNILYAFWSIVWLKFIVSLLIFFKNLFFHSTAFDEGI